MSGTLADLESAILEELDDTYQLVYVHYTDQLTDEQVNWLLADDFESLWESVAEWESDARYVAARDIVDDLAAAIVDRWRREAETDEEDDALVELLDDDFTNSRERDDLILSVEERDSSDVIRDLARNTPGQLFRVAIEDFDGSYWDKEADADDVPTPAAMLATAKLDETPENVDAAQSIIDNADTLGTLFYLFYADLDAIMDAQPDDLLVVTNPSLLLSNVYAGNGHEESMVGEVWIRRGDLTTDSGAFGYSWDSIAGVVKSAYRTDVRIERVAVTRFASRVTTPTSTDREN